MPEYTASLADCAHPLSSSAAELVSCTGEGSSGVCRQASSSASSASAGLGGGLLVRGQVVLAAYNATFTLNTASGLGPAMASFLERADTATLAAKAAARRALGELVRLPPST